MKFVLDFNLDFKKSLFFTLYSCIHPTCQKIRAVGVTRTYTLRRVNLSVSRGSRPFAFTTASNKDTVRNAFIQAIVEERLFMYCSYIEVRIKKTRSSI
jgi:hypothetical protein